MDPHKIEPGYRLNPFWFWNHRLDKTELIRQLDDFRSKGLGGAVMHARHGLKTPYLSDEWMRLAESCCEYAEKHGLWLWLYDEENWPSGPVGGKLLDAFPEFRMCQLYPVFDKTFCDKSTRPILLRTRDKILYAFAMPLKNGRLNVSSPAHVPFQATPEGISITPPAYKCRLIVIARTVFTKYFMGGYIDVFNKKAVEKFIELTHEKYHKSLGQYFGKSIRGIFTDEPSMYYSEQDVSVQWSPVFPEEFRRRYGYGIEKAVLAQFVDIGDETPKVRVDYMRMATELYRDSFFKPIFEFCEKNNILSIGHIDSEGEFLNHIREQGDFFESAKYLHYAGVDALFDTTWPKKKFPNNLLGPKFASSAAHFLNKPKTMCESFGVAAGWKLTLETIRWLTNWHIAMGINYFIPHAMYYSIEGFRKWECTPAESYQNPYWKYYDAYAEYAGRLCKIFSNGKHVVPVVMLSPVNTAWAEMDASSPAKKTAADKIRKNLEDTSEKLLRNQIDFNLINEELLQRELSRDNRPDFNTIILPGVKTMSRETAKILVNFVEGGGSLHVLYEMPVNSIEAGRNDAEIKNTFKNILNGHNRNVKFYAALTPKGIGIIRQSANPQYGLAVPNRDIVIRQYRKPEGDYLFVFNTSREKPACIELKISNAGSATALRLAQGEAKVIKIGSAETPCVEAEVSEGKTPPRTIKFSNKWRFETEKMNYLPLNRCYELINPESDFRDWGSYGHEYHLFFNMKDAVKPVYLLCDGLMHQEIYGGYRKAPVKITVNGKQAKEFKEGTLIDRLIPEADITGFIKKGVNEVIIHTHGGLHDAAVLHQPLIVAGKFACRKDNHALTAPAGCIETGSWTEQGYAFFAGTGVYRQEVMIKPSCEFLSRDAKSCVSAKNLNKALLRFENVRDTVEVHVNGVHAGNLLWHPYELDVAEYLKPGKNTFEFRVTNTLANLFLQKPQPAGILGEVFLTICSSLEGIVTGRECK